MEYQFENVMQLELNQRLLSVYEKNIGLLNVADEAKSNLSSPFLMLANKTYLNNFQKRVIVWGQETNGWGPCFETFEKLIEDSPLEAAKNRMAGHYEFLPKPYNSPFWNAFCKIAKARKKSDLMESTFLWGNVSVLDYCQGSIFKRVPKSLKKNVLTGVLNYSEIMFNATVDVLQPKIMVFFTGLNGMYDRYMNLPKDWRVQNITSLDECYKKNSPYSSWVKTFEWDGVLCFKTYHPGYLLRKHAWEILDVIADTIYNIQNR